MQKSFIYTLLFVGLCMGLLVTWQFSTNVPLNSNFPTDVLETKDSLIKDFLDEQAYLQSKIVSLRKEIENSQNNIETQSETSNLALLENLKQHIGLKDVRGKGLEIFLNDSPLAIREGADVTDEQLVQAADIRDIVNVLNASNAEAISVNNQRVIATSPISSVGSTLLVNDFYISPPFTITAVGDTEMMLQRLLDENSMTSLSEKIKKSKIVFQISVKEWLTIAMYNGNLKSEYISLIE